MKRAAWRNLEGSDEQYEIELRPDFILAIHREDGSPHWQAMLFESGSEETPFLTFSLRAVSVRGAQREAIKRTVASLFKLVEALSRVKVAA